jgi:predicted site-specific integrase-resolvase
MAKPPINSISGGRLESAAIHLHVRAIETRAGAGELLGFLAFASKRFHDPVPRERFGADMGQLLERLLAAVRCPAGRAARGAERVDDQRRADEAEDRQPRVVVEQQRAVSNQRERLSRQIAGCLRDGLLDLADIVVDAGHQLSGRPLCEKGSRLSEDVAVQRVAYVHDDALAHARHQVRRDVRTDALEEIEADNRPSDERQVLLLTQHVVEDPLDEPRQPGRTGCVKEHSHYRPRQPPVIGTRVAEQAAQCVGLAHECAAVR